ncbi:hypothetical protein AGABI1DRAFT_39848, partial [Agaricus bisporus var. burnettii JB137-S8]
GKTSFLRLLLDTSDIAPSNSKDQLTAVAKFVQGSSGHTSFFRTTSVDIDLGPTHSVALNLIDSPSLDFRDDAAADRTIADTLRVIDHRFMEGLEDDRKAHTGDRYVHLCIYFLDPDTIVPPSVRLPVPRTRTNSFSQPEQEPVILEPPVTSHVRPTLPAADIATIRQLSARVNVLPVIARADMLSNERLAAVKLAVRHDLADAGIGFGIFDVDNHHPIAPPSTQPAAAANGYGPTPPAHLNGGSTSAATSPPTSPVSPSMLRLPYALVSPDIYSHSEGVARIPPSRHELVQQYTPSSTKISRRGRFLRHYRWGTLDVLDPAHSDFVPLRNAIFHHMETLQKYTREYLFEKFRSDYIQQQQQQQRPPSRQHPTSHSLTHSHSLPHSHSPHAISHLTHPHPLGHMPGLASHPARPILAIDTQPPPQHPTQGLHHPQPLSSIGRPGQPNPANKARSKKITVACNFCRSRKLKCDGGRPACGQCLKRSNPCDYAPQNKRRNTLRQRRPDTAPSRPGDDDDDNSTGAPPPPQHQPHPSLHHHSDRDPHPRHLREREPPIPSSHQNPLPLPSQLPPHGGNSSGRPFFPDNELPHIATLSLPDRSSPSTPGPMSAPSLPPIRPASDHQAALRKRAATVPGKTGTGRGSGTGPKVVACNSCRARKTKCDGAHPACASCARRQVVCLYVHDVNGNASRDPSSGAASSLKKQDDDSPRSLSPPSSRMLMTPTTAEMDLKRPLPMEHLDRDVDMRSPHDGIDMRAVKKMRMEEGRTVAPAGIP